MYLNTHTYYSLRYGTFSPETLLELGRSMGLSCFALTDINTTSACLDFIRLAPKYGIRPIVGVDFREGIKQHYIALAKDNDGFSEINRHLTGILNKDVELESEAPAFEGAFVVYPFEKNNHRILRKNEFIGISPQDLPYIRLKHIDSLIATYIPFFSLFKRPY